MKKLLVTIIFALSLTMGPIAYAKKPQPEPQYEGICFVFPGTAFKLCIN